MLACRVFGHDFRFWAEDSTMRWECIRGCGAGGAKSYDSPEAARRYARTLDRTDREDLGRRAPFSVFPLRMARRRR